MKKIETQYIKCECKKEQCPVYKRCCFLPTECHPNLDNNVEILFVGQGGGKEERKKGRPFIGPAGKRLRKQVIYTRKKLKKQIGVAFSNTIRDNPDGNRPPTPEELELCLNFLYNDIKYLKEERGLKIVIPLGNSAKKALIEESAPALRQDRGKVYIVKNKIFGSVPMMPTFHPSYIIRTETGFNEEKLGMNESLIIEDMVSASNYQPEPEESIETETLDIFK